MSVNAVGVACPRLSAITIPVDVNVVVVVLQRPVVHETVHLLQELAEVLLRGTVSDTIITPPSVSTHTEHAPRSAALKRR